MTFIHVYNVFHDASSVCCAQNGAFLNPFKNLDSAEHGHVPGHVILVHFRQTSTRPETWPCALCRTLKTCYFQVVTLTTKATTLATIKILNYNICNTHFKHSKQIKMITNLVTINMYNHHIHNSCKYQHA